MIHSFELPRDWYPWGQDRMGSLIPLLGSILLKQFHIPALVAESIVHYLLLIAGYCCFASLLKKNFSKLLLAVFWFFPPMRLIDITQIAFGIHYSLIGVCCYLLKLKEDKNLNGSDPGNLLILAAFAMVSIIAVWVCDFALFSLTLLAVLYFYYRTYQHDIKRFFRQPDFYFFIATILLGYVIINAMKSEALKVTYSDINSIGNMMKAFGIFASTLFKLLTFDKSEPLTGVYIILLLLLLFVLSISRKREINSEYSRFWIRFFVADACMMFALFMFSEWAFENNVPRRYFVCNYISLGMALLIYIDSREIKRLWLVNCLALLTVVSGAVGTLYNLKYVWPATLKPKAEFMAEFEQLGNIGIIGEYFNSYICSVTAPDSIFATSHDGGPPRNQELADAVFKQKRLFINRDMWLDSFPDTLHQFGRTLVKSGDEFFMGDSHLCEYRISQ